MPKSPRWKGNCPRAAGQAGHDVRVVDGESEVGVTE